MPDPVTTPTSPSSSSPASPSPSPAAPAPSAASSPTPDPTPAPKAERPSYIPEQFWDPQANTVKEQDFSAELNRLTAVDLENKTRLAAVPAKPDDYQLVNSSDFKLPDDFAFEFDAANPGYAALREFAQANGVSQTGFSKLLDIYVQDKVAEAQFVQAESAKQVEKLGANGPARVDTVKAWFKARLGEEAAAIIMERPVIAAEIEAYEKLMAAFSNVVPFSNQNRERPTNQPSEEEWNKLNPSARLALGRKLEQTTGR